jgi:hypothetical protein
MNKIVLASGSFIVGAVVGSLVLSLIHASTQVHAFQGLGVGISDSGAEPVVPPLCNHIIGGGILGGAVQALDGIDCDECVLDVGRFTYAGGAFRLNNAHLRTNAPVELKGAALNTLNLLRALGALPSPPPKPQSKPPFMSMAALEMKAQSDLTLVSVEGIAAH